MKLVERENELDALASELQNAREGRCQVVLIRGEAGITTRAWS